MALSLWTKGLEGDKLFDILAIRSSTQAECPDVPMFSSRKSRNGFILAHASMKTLELDAKTYSLHPWYSPHALLFCRIEGPSLSQSPRKIN